MEERFLHSQANRFARANREEKALACSARNDGSGAAARSDRSTESLNGSRENWTQVKERSTCTRLEQMRRRVRVRNSAESSQPSACRRRLKAARLSLPPPK